MLQEQNVVAPEGKVALAAEPPKAESKESLLLLQSFLAKVASKQYVQALAIGKKILEDCNDADRVIVQEFVDVLATFEDAVEGDIEEVDEVPFDTIMEEEEEVADDDDDEAEEGDEEIETDEASDEQVKDTL